MLVGSSHSTTSLSRFVQSWNASCPMYVTDSGIVSSRRLRHPRNARSFTRSSVSGRVTASSAGNAPMLPIVSNPSPANTTFVTAGNSAVQFQLSSMNIDS